MLCVTFMKFIVLKIASVQLEVTSSEHRSCQKIGTLAMFRAPRELVEVCAEFKQTLRSAYIPSQVANVGAARCCVLLCNIRGQRRCLGTSLGGDASECYFTFQKKAVSQRTRSPWSKLPSHGCLRSRC